MSEYNKLTFVESPSTPSVERRSSLRIQAIEAARRSANLNSLETAQRTPKRSNLFDKIVKSPVKRIFAKTDPKNLSRRNLTDTDLTSNNFDQFDVEIGDSNAKLDPTRTTTSPRDPETESLNLEDFPSETYFDLNGDRRPSQNEAAALPTPFSRRVFLSRATNDIADEFLHSNESLAHYDFNTRRAGLSERIEAAAGRTQYPSAIASSNRFTGDVSFWDDSAAADDPILRDEVAPKKTRINRQTDPLDIFKAPDELADTRSGAIRKQLKSPSIDELIDGLNFEDFDATSDACPVADKQRPEFNFAAPSEKYTAQQKLKNFPFSKAKSVSFNDKRHEILKHDPLKQIQWASKIADGNRASSKQLAFHNSLERTSRRPSIQQPKRRALLNFPIKSPSIQTF